MRGSGAKWQWAVPVSFAVLAGLALTGCKGKARVEPESTQAREAEDAEEVEEAAQAEGAGAVEEAENADEGKKAEDNERGKGAGVSDFVDYAIGKMPIEQGERIKRDIRDTAAEHNKRLEEAMDE
jgi:hypothetical protein